MPTDHEALPERTTSTMSETRITMTRTGFYSASPEEMDRLIAELLPSSPYELRSILADHVGVDVSEFQNVNTVTELLLMLADSGYGTPARYSSKAVWSEFDDGTLSLDGGFYSISPVPDGLRLYHEDLGLDTFDTLEEAKEAAEKMAGF